MEKQRRYTFILRCCLGAAVCAAAVSGLFWLLSAGLLSVLRPLAEGFTENDTILRALETLRGAAIWPPLWWTVPAGGLLYGGGVMACRSWRQRPGCRLHAALWGLATLLFLLPAFLFSLWMTRINGVPVHTMAAVLWKYLSGGALSGL